MSHYNGLIAQIDQDYTKWILIATGILVFVYGLLIGNYFLSKPNNLPEWDDRITAKCGADYLVGAYDAYSLRDIGDSALGFGSYFGLLFASAVFPN